MWCLYLEFRNINVFLSFRIFEVKPDLSSHRRPETIIFSINTFLTLLMSSSILDVDECKNSYKNSCHEKAECINIPGSYTCLCKTGYQGDGFDCVGRNFSFSLLFFALFTNISTLEYVTKVEIKQHTKLQKWWKANVRIYPRVGHCHGQLRTFF